MYSGPTQVDAAAEVEEDEVLCGGGGGARATEGFREEEDARKGENEERPVVAIYKEGLISGHKKRGGRKHGYPAAQTPRFSGRLLR